MNGEPEKVTRGACIIEETFDPTTMVVIGAMTQIGRHDYLRAVVATFLQRLEAGKFVGQLKRGASNPDYLAPVTRYLVRRRTILSSRPRSTPTKSPSRQISRRRRIVRKLSIISACVHFGTDGSPAHR
jgi:hypothetical protein